MQQSVDISWPLGTQQQTRRSGVWLPNDGTDERTRRTLDSFIEPAPHTMRAMSINRTKQRVLLKLTVRIASVILSSFVFVMMHMLSFR